MSADIDDLTNPRAGWPVSPIARRNAGETDFRYCASYFSLVFINTRSAFPRPRDWNAASAN